MFIRLKSELLKMLNPSQVGVYTDIGSRVVI